MADEVFQGKILSIVPKIGQNGVQETYFYQAQNKSYLLYTVTVIFSSGRLAGQTEIGEAKSESSAPKWTLNEDVTITRKAFGQQGQFIKYSFKFD